MNTDSVPADQRGDNQPPYPLIIPESNHPIRISQLDREALKVLYRLRDAGFKGYLVGGGVRDLYLGKAPNDFDISTDARPGQLRKLFRNSRTIGRRFRLVQVFFRGNKIIEVSTLRSQSEYDINDPDKVLPHNNTFGTLEEDAFRRDLTINALFYEIETNTIIDYAGGVEDLKSGVIRVVGDPGRRFTRDPVRMLRAVRHAARTGFVIEKDTFTAIGEHVEKLLLCPPSRLRDEIFKDLKSGASQQWATLCMETPLWETLFPMYSARSFSETKDGVKKELLALLAVVDRLNRSNTKGEQQVDIPDFMLLSLLLLPWAKRHFQLFESLIRGKQYHQLLKKIRTEVDTFIGKPFNLKRMIKDGVTTLLLNLSTFHYHHTQEKSIPKWLRRKSYFRDCSRFYGIYQESIGINEANSDDFYKEQKEEVVMDGGRGNSGSPGRKGGNPAFSSNKTGVFGLRNQG